ncbi:MAG: pyruvate, phosphate dikinase [Nanoarchaeota archaeon]|nr:pyruvate, phosphate dikinase [Nanoarchaeota archaeon]
MKRIYQFGEGNKDMKELLGGKGANLQEMFNLGVEVPAFFTITTEACKEYYSAKDKDALIRKVMEEAEPYLKQVEEKMGKSFGSKDKPLLVSVRSGAAVSMPGMMNTILNIGLCDSNLKSFAKSFSGERFALDGYRRLLQMFGDTVFDAKEVEQGFKDAMEEVKAKLGKDVKDTDLGIKELKELVERFKQVYKDNGLSEVLKECFENNDSREASINQLRHAIDAVFKSSQGHRALVYKKQEGLPADMGTAVNVQAMVFGNTGDDSATGVLFTRNNATGEKGDGKRILYGDWLLNAQGEDVVAGIRNTMPIEELGKAMPEIYAELRKTVFMLEKHYKDMQDIEFTVEEGKLWMLQTRMGKRSSLAKLVCAVDMVKEGLIDEREAVRRFGPEDMEVLMHPVFDPKSEKKQLSSGSAAGPGEVSGLVAFTPEKAVELGKQGKDVILVRPETSPEDVHGMLASKGIYTRTGGLTSHAAIVGKQFNKAVIVGDSSLQIDEKKGLAMIGGKEFKEGQDYISISGTTGKVFEGRVASIESEIERVAKGELDPLKSKVYSYFQDMMGYAKAIKKLGVRANADTGSDSRIARLFGAEGIGLLRTEHTMFNEPEQIMAMREMILAADTNSREKALMAIEPLQMKNFVEVFKAMSGLPVTIRLLDPPLDEFLPNTSERIREAAEYICRKYGGEKAEVESQIRRRLSDLKEANPMMGFRGNRLSVVYPEIARMQARSIFEAMYKAKLAGAEPVAEIMAPVTICEGEIRHTGEIVEKVRKEMEKKFGKLPILFGTMIETPRAALDAGKIAQSVDFFSFGTNDLTQLTDGMDRNSAGVYLNEYVGRGWLGGEPFVTIDKTGPGKLVEMAVDEGKKTNPKLKLGVCGEHGADPESIYFFEKAGMDYVSCGAFKVPIAILAAAHIELKD